MLKNTQNTFTKGMDWNSLPDLVSKDNYEYCLNGVVESPDGDMGGLVSESSNYACAILPSNYIIIGSVKVSSRGISNYILFGAKLDLSNSALFLFNPSTCTISTLVENPCFNFDSRHPINAIAKTKDNSDNIVFFTDKINKYRSINIDDLNLYNDATTGTFSCPLMDYSRNLMVPEIKALEVTEGGSLSLGSYRAYVRYVTSDNTKGNIINQTDDVLIYKDSTANSYFNIDGGFNISSTGQVGTEQYPKSNKSITFQVTNLDLNYKSIEIVIVEYISGTGAVSSVKTSPLIAINGNTSVNWTYTGTNAFSSGSTDSIASSIVSVTNVIAHTQKDNRLFLGNIQESDTLDYGTIQRAALGISVRWKAKKIVKFNPQVLGDSKNPIQHNSYMRDEVYAIGVQGVKLDGTRTPVFHIPGRLAIASTTSKIDLNEVWTIRDAGVGLWDKQLMNTNLGVDLGLGETGHVTKYIVGNQIERWRVYNTGYVDTNTSTELNGVLGYYECDELYPNINTPAGPLYGALTGSPIRHHKLPDTNTVLHATNSELRPMQLEVDLSFFISVLPTSITNTIQKWVVVQADRTVDNKTVLDKGITTIDENKRQTSGLGSQPYSSTNIRRFYSAKSLYKKTNFNATHYKVEYYNDLTQIRLGANPGTNDRYTDTQNNRGPGSGPNFYYEFHDWVGKLTQDIFGGNRKFSNFKITGASYVNEAIINGVNETKTQGLLYDSNGTLSSLNETSNASYNTPIYHMFMLSGSDLKFNVTYGSLKQEKSVYGNLSVLTYFDVLNQKETIGSPNLLTLYGGDTFITNLTVLIGSMCPGEVRFDAHYLWVESELNIGLRHGDNVFSGLDSQIYYKGWKFFDGIVVESPLFALDEYLISLHRANGGFGTNLIKAGAEKFMRKEALQYNTDYGYQNPVRPYYPNSDNYDYTQFLDTKKGRSYYRIRYSEKDFQEALTDNYKNILTLNYVDIDAQHGEITDLFVDKNDLFCRTHKTLLLVPTNVQSIQGNETSVFLGKSDVIPYEPKPISTTPNNYGGGYDFTHRLNTEYGTILLDIYSRRCFILRDGLNDISEGMHAFFNAFGSWDFLDRNCDYTRDSVRMYYDTWLSRFLITMKKLKLKTPSAFIGHTLIYEEGLDRIKHIFPNGTIVYYTTSTIGTIANIEEWTISYNFKTKSWTSFHSYKPDWAFSNNNGFTSYRYNLADNLYGLYNHNDNPNLTYRWLNFYGAQYPFEIETTINSDSGITKSLEHLSVFSETGTWNYIDAYTDKQHTGHRPLVYVPQQTGLMSRELSNGFLSTITSKEGYFNISNLFDKVIDSSQPIFDPLTYTRLVKDLNGINFYASVTMDQGKLRNDWIKVKLQYNLNLMKPRKQTIWSINALVNQIQR